MKQRYWILTGYLLLLFIAPWIIDWMVAKHIHRQGSNSMLLEILYSIVLTGVWMWAYAFIIAILISIGLVLMKRREQEEPLTGFQLVAKLHIGLIIGLAAYSFFATGAS